MEGERAMSTVIRPEISEKNPYWIERHRYYELKHFCMQYSGWKKKLKYLDGYLGGELRPISCNKVEVDPTYNLVKVREQYVRWCEIVENTAKEAAAELSPYILKGITEGISYNILSLKTQVPCCRDIYYYLYRRFFWLLNRARN